MACWKHNYGEIGIEKSAHPSCDTDQNWAEKLQVLRNECWKMESTIETRAEFENRHTKP